MFFGRSTFRTCPQIAESNPPMEFCQHRQSLGVGAHLFHFTPAFGIFGVRSYRFLKRVAVFVRNILFLHLCRVFTGLSMAFKVFTSYPIWDMLLAQATRGSFGHFQMFREVLEFPRRTIVKVQFNQEHRVIKVQSQFARQ